MPLTRESRKRNFESISTPTKLTTNQYNELHSKGFIIIKNFIDIDQTVVKKLKNKLFAKEFLYLE